IEQLNDEDRRLLIAASVQGYEFDSAVLAEVLDVDAEQLEERLAALEGIHAFVVLIDEREFPDLTPTLRYRFVHVLYQNVLYASVRPTRKASLSAAVAKTLLDHYGEQRSEIASELAFLFKAGRDFEQAAEYFLLAAENAARVYANQEAIRFYENAGEMVSQLSRGSAKAPAKLSELRVQIHEELGGIFKTIGKYDEARESYEKAIADLSRDEKLRIARLYRHIGKSWQAQRQSDSALKAFVAAEESLGQEPGEPDKEWKEWKKEWIQIQLERVWVLYWLGQLEELNDLTTRIRPILEQHGSQTQRGLFFHSLMLYHLRRDRFVTSDETVKLAQTAAAAIEGSDDLAEVASNRFGAGFAYLWRGDLDEAESHIKVALRSASRRGDSINQVLCLTYLAIIYRKRGKVEETQSYISQALDAATAGKMMTYIGMAKANLAWVAWRGGNYAEAKEHGRAALELWQDGQGSYPFQWAALWPLVGVALAENSISEAIENARALLVPAQQRLPDELTSLVKEAVNASSRDQSEATRERLAEALKLAQELSYL
ncbi:MAG: hypothetical protein M3Y84_12010, partial [Acidobacteriota bacterium]|nr:hypothetical protein [Acidobacteriota bacterium]